MLLAGVFYFLDQHLDWFYIFSPAQLKDLSQRAITAHGNDTTAVVQYIVGELSEKLPGGYVNLDEEWIFNNAGGAMGAMYIIHASESPSHSDWPRRNGREMGSYETHVISFWPGYRDETMNEADQNRHHRIPHHFRYCYWNRRPHRPPHR